MASWNDINTFKDIFEIVKNIETIEEFNKLLLLKTNGKDVLETILRLFAYTDCILELKEFKTCTGNFNLATIKVEKYKKNLFYEFRNNNIVLKKVKDSGDSSDLTLLNEKKNILLAFTSKNLLNKNMNFDNMDLTKLFYYGKNYESYKVEYAVCCNDKKVFYEMIDNAKNTTLKKSEKNKMKNMIVIDRETLKCGFKIFKNKYENMTFEDMLNKDLELEITKEIIFRPHQEYTINKSFYLIKEYNQSKKYINILWGHVARSGKSYMMFGLIHKLFKICEEKELNMNICIITTAPNETIKQYLDIAKDLKIEALKNTNIITSLDYEETEDSRKLFIFSKQLLTHKDNKNKAKLLFKKHKIYVLLTDETHNGGSTNLSKDLIKTSFSKCHKIFITATYNKVAYNFDIHETIKWSLEDIQIMKNGNIQSVYDDSKQFISEENMNSEDYKMFPNLSIIGVDNLFENPEEQLLSLFNMTSNKFKNEETIFETIKYILCNVLRNIDLMNKKVNQRPATLSKDDNVPLVLY